MISIKWRWSTIQSMPDKDSSVGWSAKKVLLLKIGFFIWELYILFYIWLKWNKYFFKWITVLLILEIYIVDSITLKNTGIFKGILSAQNVLYMPGCLQGSINFLFDKLYVEDNLFPEFKFKNDNCRYQLLISQNRMSGNLDTVHF